MWYAQPLSRMRSTTLYSSCKAACGRTFVQRAKTSLFLTQQKCLDARHASHVGTGADKNQHEREDTIQSKDCTVGTVAPGNECWADGSQNTAMATDSAPSGGRQGNSNG